MYDTELSEHIHTWGSDNSDNDILDRFELYRAPDGKYFWKITDETGPDWLELVSEKDLNRLKNDWYI